MVTHWSHNIWALYNSYIIYYLLNKTHNQRIKLLTLVWKVCQLEVNHFTKNVLFWTTILT